ncbi:hypothetical protein BCR36DRAFT_580980 [Piromyces finnis]|uniref:Rad21/Rec8-like protein N-terminal domain-containing protein n=1 Tax=Piromyces finnis TaxID=1754191 RepID=A0A1Y1VJ47_9FUNG|nr:hypothetical protein BCR36DRAFT_580980 [Piromyces finnis]|eukprot:ORX56667.1 hypothetical protein BCR36DRAFT_580980 [Piromyces finnis]
MFYSESILLKKGPLAKVWLAAHWERKLSKANFLQANIETSVGAILGNDRPPMALRLSGQLLLGVVRIYSRKTRYLLEDCNEAIVKIKMTFQPGSVNLSDEQIISNDAITLKDTITEFDILLPERTFENQNWNNDKFQLSLSQPSMNISIIDKDIETPKHNAYNDMLVDPLEFNPASPEINLFNPRTNFDDSMEIETLRDLQRNTNELENDNLDIGIDIDENIFQPLNDDSDPFAPKTEPKIEINDSIDHDILNDNTENIFKSVPDNIDNMGPIEIKEEPVETKENIDLDILEKKIKIEEEYNNGINTSTNEDSLIENQEERERIERERVEREKMVNNLPEVDINDYQLDNGEDENNEGIDLSTSLSALSSHQQRPQRKRKIILYDDQIELLGEQISSQLKNPTNTLVKDELLLFRPSKYIKLIKNISKDEIFLENNSIIFNIELYQDTPIFKMPPFPPSEYIFKTDMLEETDNLNEISKVDISLDKGDENDNILDNNDLNLPDIESFDFTIDNTTKLDDNVEEDNSVDENAKSQDVEKKLNISMDEISVNEDKSENFDNEISNIQADDNDEVPIISAVEPNENEQTSWSSVIHDEFEEKDSISFKETAKAKDLTRKEAVNFFFEVLSMTTKNLLKVEQNEAYGNIKITPKEALFNRL